MLMRFFTMEWWGGFQRSQSDDSAGAGVCDDDVPNRYQAYFESIRDKLPSTVAALNEVNLHDSTLELLRIDPSVSRMELRVKMCDWTGAAGAFTATFVGVQEVRFFSDPEQSLPGPGGFGDLGYWEVDLAEDGYEFRALFSTGIEMAVRFSDVTTSIASE
jgi:hypothetical protein